MVTSNGHYRTRRFPQNRVRIGAQPAGQTRVPAASNHQQVGLPAARDIANGDRRVAELDRHFTVRLRLLLEPREPLAHDFHRVPAPFRIEVNSSQLDERVRQHVHDVQMCIRDRTDGAVLFLWRLIAIERQHKPDVYKRQDYWMPMANEQQVEGFDYLHSRISITVTVIGRLKPGVMPRQATENLNAIAAELAKEYPETDDGLPLRLLSLIHI